MSCKITIHKGESNQIISVNEGDNLLEALKENDVILLSPCGGKGTCGKCKVRVRGQDEEITEKERKLLASVKKDSGARLACYLNVKNDLDVYLESNENEATILTDGISGNIELDPLLKKTYSEIKRPDITDQRSDVQRIEEVFSGCIDKRNISFIREIPFVLRDEYDLTAIMEEDEIKSLEKGNTTEKFYGMAVDIGTTTAAFYLYDLRTGEKKDVHSVINPQTKHGADVLSRIEYTNGSAKKQLEMRNLIIDCINDAVKVFTRNNEIRPEDIYMMVFAGNTTMTHFLAGIPAKNIAVSPFIPASTEMHKIPVSDLGIGINSGGMALILPGVSAYIGSDTVACVLSSGMYHMEDISLLIDIGTNGEIVLGCRDFMYSCSTAAGPAFEGSNIQCGIGGVNGAIDKIFFNRDISFTTIGDYEARGICGSGIVDAVAGMLKQNIIDETGRIVDKDEIEEENYRNKIFEINNGNALILDENNTDIFITQKDIRELQNAKAAIAAGIKILIKRAGISPDKIKNVFLAGGFGNYINIDSAFMIGLLPSELKRDSVVSVGNAAGAGAVMALLSKEALKETIMIKEKIQYIELSSSKDFVDEYVNAMFF